jgi:hypothetical protein
MGSLKKRRKAKISKHKRPQADERKPPQEALAL